MQNCVFRCVSSHAARFHERRISSVTFSSAHLYGNVVREHVLSHCHVFGSQRVIVVKVVELVGRRSIRPILGFWGSKVHKNGTFPAFDADEPLCKISRC